MRLWARAAVVVRALLGRGRPPVNGSVVGPRSPFTTMKLAAFLFCLLPLFTTAQTEFTEVVEVPGAATIDLYHRSERWFVDTFKDASSVIQIRDSTQKMIVGKGASTIYWSYGKGMSKAFGNLPAGYSVEAKCKESRCRLRIYDLQLSGYPHMQTLDCVMDMSQYPEPKNNLERKSFAMAPELHKQKCEQFGAVIESLKATYKAALTAQPKTDDW